MHTLSIFSLKGREMGTQLDATNIYADSHFVWKTSHENQSGKQWVENAHWASYKPLAYEN